MKAKSAQVTQLPVSIMAALDKAEKEISKFRHKGWDEMSEKILREGMKRKLSSGALVKIFRTAGYNYSANTLLRHMSGQLQWTCPD